MGGVTLATRNAIKLIFMNNTGSDMVEEYYHETAIVILQNFSSFYKRKFVKIMYQSMLLRSISRFAHAEKVDSEEGIVSFARIT